MTTWRIATAFLVLGVAAVAHAQTPVGRWKTIDDSSKKAKSIVQLWQKGDQILGTIQEVFPEPGKPADPVCDKCDGYLKDKPIKGMTILWGLKQDGDEWSGGRILDPENGKVYRCWIQVVDGGARLKVRGYIGLSVIGRTQYWERVP